jgi:hypothetical protein
VVNRNRTPLKYVGHALYIYFLGLSLRKTSARLLSSVLSKEIMFLYGIGFRNTGQRNYYLQLKERFMNIL